MRELCSAVNASLTGATSEVDDDADVEVEMTWPEALAVVFRGRGESTTLVGVRGTMALELDTESEKSNVFEPYTRTSSLGDWIRRIRLLDIAGLVATEMCWMVGLVSGKDFPRVSSRYPPCMMCVEMGLLLL